jgi:hypothetical protein
MPTTHPTTLAPINAFALIGGAPGSATFQTVAEFVTFRLKAGISDQSFLAAADQTRAFLNDIGAVLRRSLSKDDSELWTDHILWTSMDIAKSTAEVAMQHPDFAPMMSMIDPKSVELRHAPVLMQMD